MTTALDTIARAAEPWSPQGEAAEALARLGLPTRRNETWKYSDLRAAMADEALMRDAQLAHGHSTALEPDVPRLEAARNVIGLLALAMEAHVPDAIGDSRFTRGAGGSVTEFEARGSTLVVEDLNADGQLAAHLWKARVREGATLTRVVIQSGDGVALSAAEVAVEKGGRFRQFVLAHGAKLARIETTVTVEGEGASIELNGVYLAGADRHADMTSVITHAVPDGTTRQLIKGVARKGGRGVFQGKIVVAPQAQKTDARQYHHGLLLEDGAEIYAKPELMIHADDVQCAHGNTAGGLDEGALFYMRSRGLPEAEARAMLLEAFLVEAIPEGIDAAIRDELTGRIGAWLRETGP